MTHIDPHMFDGTKPSTFISDITKTDVTHLMDEAIRNSTPRLSNNRLVYEYDFGSVIGTKGQTSMRVVVDQSGIIITTHPIP